MTPAPANAPTPPPRPPATPLPPNPPTRNDDADQLSNPPQNGGAAQDGGAVRDDGTLQECGAAEKAGAAKDGAAVHERSAVLDGGTTPDGGAAHERGVVRDGGLGVRRAAAVLREAASAVEGADLSEALASGGRAAIVAALERIAAACPGTLAVAVRPAMRPAVRAAAGAPGVPLGPSLAGLALNEDVELPLASVGKLLLLAEVAMSVDGGILDPDEPVPVHDDDYCGGSGLLLGLSARTWTVGDLALLTAAVSDNTATNALLRRIGLDRVNAAGAALGLTRTRLLDRIREPRGPEHPATFSIGTAGELAGLAALVAGPDGWQVLMREWMLANTDHGLVPALMWHDPEGTRIANKTGTDDGIRTDVGLMGPLAYAVLAGGPPGSDQHLAHAVRQAGALIATTTHL